jgi:hypothetical protein
MEFLEHFVWKYARDSQKCRNIRQLGIVFGLWSRYFVAANKVVVRFGVCDQPAIGTSGEFRFRLIA